jgi:hypothetical protein
MTPISGFGSGLLLKLGSNDIEGLVNTKVTDAINFFIIFSTLVAVGLLVASGYMFITSAGDPEKIEKAQKGVTAAIVGMVIVFLARMIVGFVISSILNV